MTETFKVYVTKYALTEGVKEIEVSDCFNVNPTMVAAKIGYGFYHKGEWFRTREEALIDAERRRLRKIKSLRTQLGKLEQLRF